MIELLPQFAFNGLLIGASYALIAVGLTMIFGIMNIANFAHGEFYMLGGCVTFFFAATLGLNYFAAVLLAVVVVAAFGFLLERVIFRALRSKPAMSSVLATVSLAMILENGALYLWGPQPRPIPTGLSPIPIEIGPIFTTEARLIT